MNEKSKSIKNSNGVNKLSRAKYFIMQPFGQRKDPKTGKTVDNDTVYNTLKKLEKIRPGKFPINIYRADVEKYDKAELHAHVYNCLKKSDFCIADFTGRNLNVIYETGIARGLDREVILLCQDRSDIPGDLSGFITVLYTMEDLSNLPNDIDQHLDRVETAVNTLRENHGRLLNTFAQEPRQTFPIKF